MSEASWGETTKTPTIEWRMSASLENVARGDGEISEVTSLGGAVRAWLELDPEDHTAATPTPERPVLIEGATHAPFAGDAIAILSESLPQPQSRQY
jgi:hypothetical protein